MRDHGDSLTEVQSDWSNVNDLEVKMRYRADHDANLISLAAPIITFISLTGV